MMTREELLEQRRQINEQLRELNDAGLASVGRARISKSHYPTHRPDDWHLQVKTETDKGKTVWRTLTTSPDRDKAIEPINDIIADLIKLRDMVREA